MVGVDFGYAVAGESIWIRDLTFRGQVLSPLPYWMPSLGRIGLFYEF